MKHIVYTAALLLIQSNQILARMAFCKHVGLGLDIPDDHQHQLPAYQPRNAKDLHPENSYLNKLGGIYRTPCFRVSTLIV